MKIAVDSVRLLAEMMISIKASGEDGAAVLLVLETEENAQEFFAWFEGRDKPPTPQECFEEALRIAGYLALFEQQEKEEELERLSVNMSESSARFIEQIMGTQKSADFVKLKLKTDENVQKLSAWFEGQDRTPTPQECFEEALNIIGYFADEEEEEED